MTDRLFIQHFEATLGPFPDKFLCIDDRGGYDILEIQNILIFLHELRETLERTTAAGSSEINIDKKTNLSSHYPLFE